MYSKLCGGCWTIGQFDLFFALGSLKMAVKAAQSIKIVNFVGYPLIVR
jgi:hypothetical protein